jgi:hypothetical protein
MSQEYRMPRHDRGSLCLSFIADRVNLAANWLTPAGAGLNGDGRCSRTVDYASQSRKAAWWRPF